MTDKPHKSVNTHTIRRIKYGTNVVVAILASVGITILINWIAARQYIRFDTTQGGRYSLSQQTETVLNKLDGEYKLVTLIPDSAPDEDTARVYEDVKDLTDVYGRFSKNLAVDHMDPRSSIKKAEALNNAIVDAFADELTPVKEAIALGLDAMHQVRPINTQLTQALTAGVNNDPNTPETGTQKFFRAAATRSKEFDERVDQVDEQAEELMDQVLVNYAGVKEQLQGVITDYNTLLDVITQSGSPLIRNVSTSNEEKERLLEAIELCKQAKTLLAEPLQKMDEAKDSPRYNQVFLTLNRGASVVALGPNKVKVIPISEMWRQDLRNIEQTGQTQPQYLIEEKLTGALLSMTIDQPPLVVFVLSNSGAALGAQGNYNNVAQRLQNADFDVRQWNPTGQISSMGQPTPPLPRPEPKPGQKIIWIVPPAYGQPMGTPMMMGMNPRQHIGDLLKERLAAGDAALVMVPADPTSLYGMPNPIVDELNTWGIKPQTDRLILEEVQLANRRSMTSLQMPVDTWPSALPITTALDGMQAMFYSPSPILVEDDKGAAHYLLVEIKGDKLWTTTDLSTPDAVRNAKFDEENSAPSYTIAYASEKDGARLVTIAEQVWATDDITGWGLFGQGTAELTGAVVPGNSELFVNSVFWLAGMEDMIAASPRSQDVPRIQPMSDSKLAWYQSGLLVGMPMSALILGVIVWSVRRRA